MKYIKQCAVILMITFLGEGLNRMLPLPIPSSIYGMVLLYVGLMLGIVKLEWVEDTGKLLIEIMPLMFIPAGVGLLEAWGILKPVCIPFITITLISTVAVMVVAGRITQFIMHRSDLR